jgi:hypothetical protein
LVQRLIENIGLESLALEAKEVSAFVTPLQEQRVSDALVVKGRVHLEGGVTGLGLKSQGVFAAPEYHAIAGDYERKDVHSRVEHDVLDDGVAGKIGQKIVANKQVSV